MTSVLAVPGALTDALALVEGTGRTSEGHLAPGVQAWLASPEQGLHAGIQSVHGAEATARALASLAPSRVTVLATVGSDRACWAEVARRTDAEAETCVAGFSFDAAGPVSRLVWLRAPLVPAYDAKARGDTPDARPTRGDTPDGRAILERYFADLMNSRFGEAAAHFTPDTLYSHPPYAGGTERILFRGREALWRGFVAERGPSPARQIITGLWQQSGRVFVQGVVEGIPDAGTFFSTAQITPEGEIARYVAFYTSQRVPSL